MPGFVLDEALYKVGFSGTKLAGLEVSLREMSTRDVLTLSTIAETFGGEGAASDPVKIAGLLDEFAGFIASWNLQGPDGAPEPVSGDTLMRYPLGRFVMPLLSACVSAISGVSDDLGKDSPSGEPSPVASLPMEPLSPNPQS